MLHLTSACSWRAPDNVLSVRQGVLDEADNQTVRHVPSRPQLKHGPLGGTVDLDDLVQSISALSDHAVT